MHSYYEFEHEFSEKNVYLESPVDRTGAPIFKAGKLVNSTIESPYMSVIRGRILPDRLRVISRNLSLSKRASQIIHELNLYPGIQTMEVAVMEKKKEQLATLAHYDLYWHENPPDFIDKEKSDLTLFKTHILQVNKCVLDASKLPDYDLIPLHVVGWIVSKRFVTMFQERGMTGCVFKPVSLA